jgi:hypothetical protein
MEQTNTAISLKRMATKKTNALLWKKQRDNQRLQKLDEVNDDNDGN